MSFLILIFATIGKCIDIICLLLDLNFAIVNALVRLVAAAIAFIGNLPMLLTHSALECLNYFLFYVFTVVDGVTAFTHNAVGGGMQLLSGVMESCKLVKFLSSHLLLRFKELLHRGLMSGHGLLRQACEGCGIVFSLLLYFVNTIVNLLLIGTQNLYTVLVSMVEAVSSPVQKALELTLTVLTFFYSTLVGASILLWTPCRLAMEFLGSLGHIFVSIFLLNLYGLLLTLAIVVSATVYLNPALSQRGAQRIVDYINTVPTLRGLQRTLWRLYMLERNLWQRLSWPRSRLGLWTTAAGRRDHRAGGGDAEQVDAQQEDREDGMATEGENGIDNALRQSQALQHEADALDVTLPSSSTHRPLQKVPSEDGDKAAPADNLLTLLHEQEERKKCVICQDSTKTVVLLPCRHLCLCRDCTNILMRQPIYQHNCPLCRHMILQTMDVYL